MQTISSPKICITGAVSLLGHYLIQELENEYQLILTTHTNSIIPLTNKQTEVIPHFDITNSNLCRTILSKVQPDVIIHLAALSNIDYCEQHKDKAYKVNVVGTQYLVETTKNSKTHFIFISSSMVFSSNENAITENVKPQPLTIYGETKYEGEKIVQEKLHNYTIVRFSTLFGQEPAGARGNDLTSYTEKLRSNEVVHLVNDRFFNPVSGKFAAKALKKIIAGHHTGIFHIGGKDTVTRYSFVQKLAQKMGISASNRLVPVRSDYFSTLAPRPEKLILATDKMERVLELSPESIEEGLTATM